MNMGIQNFDMKSGSISIHIRLDRLSRNLESAQFYLDSQIMTDMVPYMPRQTGTFINLTRMQSASYAGSGIVVAAAPPAGRFLYYGKVMVDEKTGSPWARKGAKKIVTERNLTYGNPQATPRWFETAKNRHKDTWIKEVKKIAGKGEKV